MHVVAGTNQREGGGGAWELTAWGRHTTNLLSWWQTVSAQKSFGFSFAFCQVGDWTIKKGELVYLWGLSIKIRNIKTVYGIRHDDQRGRGPAAQRGLTSKPELLINQFGQSYRAFRRRRQSFSWTKVSFIHANKPQAISTPSTLLITLLPPFPSSSLSLHTDASVSR